MQLPWIEWAIEFVIAEAVRVQHPIFFIEGILRPAESAAVAAQVRGAERIGLMVWPEADFCARVCVLVGHIYFLVALSKIKPPTPSSSKFGIASPAITLDFASGFVVPGGVVTTRGD